MVLPKHSLMDLLIITLPPPLRQNPVWLTPYQSPRRHLLTTSGFTHISNFSNLNKEARILSKAQDPVWLTPYYSHINCVSAVSVWQNISTRNQTKPFLQPALLYRLKQQLVTGQLDTVQNVRHDLVRHFWFYRRDIRAFVLLVVLRFGTTCLSVLKGQVALQHIKLY